MEYTPDSIADYRDSVIAAMERMGATSLEMKLLTYEGIINAIQNKRAPEDLAWAILQ